MATIYLFGFEPFDGRGRNASWEAVQEIPAQIGKAKLAKHLLPVRWGEPFALVKSVMRRTRKPAAIFAVGEAARKMISVETWGYNERAARQDNHGQMPSQSVIHPETTDRVQIPWNPTPVVTTLADHYPMELSTDPGRYLCNELIYELYRDYAGIDGAFPVCFIHVPLLGTKITGPRGEMVATRETLGKMLTEFMTACLPRKQRKNGAG
jgi:pyroglutamyl-peptidase